MQEKKIILWITSSYPRFKQDSASIFLRYLAEAITCHDIDLHILSPDDINIDNSQRPSSISQYYFKYFPFRRLQKLAYGSGILPNLKANPVLFIQVPFFMISQFINGWRLLTTLKPTLIHAHWIFPQGTVACLLGKIFKIPVIITAHGGDAFSLRGSLLGNIKHWSIAHCAAWTSNTVATANAVGDALPPPEIIPMGIDLKKFSSGSPERLRSTYPPNTSIILFVGRLVEKKGVQDLLIAYSLLSATQKENSQLWIIGDGDEKTSLKQLSEALEIDNNVIFWGKRPNDQLPDYYAAADIFIAPSITDSSGDTEGQGVILLEAMASGTAIISTDTGGIREVIDSGNTGILIPPQQPETLKSAIVRLLEDNQLRNTLAIHGKHAVLPYEWSNIAKQFYDLYQKVLKNNIS